MQSLPKTTHAVCSEFIITVQLHVSSFLTYLHTIDSTSAVTFALSLWRNVTNPSVLHVNAQSMLYSAILQTHSCGKRLSHHLYLNKTAQRIHVQLMRILLVLMVKMTIILKAPSDNFLVLVYVRKMKVNFSQHGFQSIQQTLNLKSV